LQEISRKKPVLKNRVSQEIENAGVMLAVEQSGQVRVRQLTEKCGLRLSRRVRCVWLRHDLGTLKKRLYALKPKVPKKAWCRRRRRSSRWKRPRLKRRPMANRERASGILRGPGYVLVGDLK
jgi:hypothetical protein